jgi:hypothetical protein
VAHFGVERRERLALEAAVKAVCAALRCESQQHHVSARTARPRISQNSHVLDLVGNRAYKTHKV